MENLDYNSLINHHKKILNVNNNPYGHCSTKDFFPENIIGCKDSTYNLYDKVKIKDFLMFPGDESKLLKGLELGCSGCISAIANVTHKLAREVFDDYEKNKSQNSNDKLIAFIPFSLLRNSLSSLIKKALFSLSTY